MQNASLEARCVADCERLLGEVRRRYRRDYAVPAEVIQEAIWASKFRIVYEEVESDTDLAFCDVDGRRVVLCKNFTLKLQYPLVAHQVRNFTLAHELGHIRLHARRLEAGDWDAGWEDEANFYARTFLIPRRLLMSRPQLAGLLQSRRATSEERWEYVLELAEFFRVSGKFMVHTLDAYGLIVFDPATRWITLPPPSSVLPGFPGESRAERPFARPPSAPNGLPAR